MKRFLILSILMCAIPVFAQTSSTTTTNTAEPSSADLTKISNLNYNASINEGDIDVNVTPEYPSAYQTVTMRLDSNSVDLNRYSIQWFIDDVPKLSGIGKRDFQITSGNYGSVTKIVVVITIDGTSIQKKITLAPQDVTMLWEAIDSYVPPFYRGKKLASQESLIKVSAIPNFQGGNKSLGIDNAVFLWDRNGNKILNVGGYAKDSIVIQHNRLRASENIAAKVSTVSGGSNAKQSITIPIVDPEIHWYTKNITNYRRLNAIDKGLRVASGDTKIIAEPYFFSLNRNPDELGIEWTMNGQGLYLDPESSKQEIVVRNPNQAGQSNFSIAIKNPKTFLQEAAKSVSIYFEKVVQ